VRPQQVCIHLHDYCKPSICDALYGAAVAVDVDYVVHMDVFFFLVCLCVYFVSSFVLLSGGNALVRSHRGRKIRDGIEKVFCVCVCV